MSQSILATFETDWLLTGCLAKGESARKLPINASPYRVGRLAGLSLQLPSPRVSKVHAEIVAAPDGLLVRDLKSTNGTYVNGQRIRRDTPVGEGDRVQFADTELRLERAVAERSMQTIESQSFEWVWTLTQFDRLIDEEGIIPHYQPIVSLRETATIGYEVLARSTVPGMENPKLMFEASEQLGREFELSQLCRREGLRVAQALPGYPLIYLNTHPSERLQDEIVPALTELREQWPDQPVVIEIHEAAVTDPATMKEFRAALRDVNVELAYDDFGAGQSRLLDLIAVPPEYLKFDMGLVRNIHQASPQHQQMLATLVRMVRDIGTIALAEGIECREEAAVCRQLGFDYAQGYYFGRPSSIDHVLADVLAARAPVKTR